MDTAAPPEAAATPEENSESEQRDGTKIRFLDEDSNGVAELLVTVYGKKKEDVSETENTTATPVVKENRTTETVYLNGVDKITDEDFRNPFRNITLPSLPANVLNVIAKKSKPLLLKRNILNKNKEHHPELSAADSRRILNKALYHSERIIQDKPLDKPNYWVMAKLDNKSSVVTIELAETKENYEIFGWALPARSLSSK